MPRKGIALTTLYRKFSGSSTWSAADAWSNTGASGMDSSGPPTAADDCICESFSGPLTIDSGAVCRSLDCQGGTGSYSNILTHNAGVTLTIGDGTAGAGNRALRLSSGMTYTLGSSTTATITFVSTSATQQTIELAGKTSGGMIFNASSNGSWSHSDAINCGTGTITITKGTWTANGQTITAGTLYWLSGSTKSITFGASTATLSNNTAISATVTGTTLSAGSATFNCTSQAPAISGDGQTFGTVNFTAVTDTSSITGANTYAALSVVGSTSKVAILSLSANQTVTGTCTLTGNSKTNRLLVKTDTLGTARTLSAGTFALNGVDCRDIAFAGVGSKDFSAASNYSGDCGGNSGGATFTSPTTQTWATTSGGNWSANAWTSRVPLPQDDVTINAAFSASQTITADMPRLGKSITFANSGNSVALAKTTATTIYGGLVMTGTSLMTNSGTASFTFEGRGAFTLTSAGQTFTNPITIAMVGGTLTQQDAFAIGTSQAISHLNGTWDCNGFTATCNSYTSANTNVRALTLGSGTLTCGGVGACFNVNASSNLTISAASGTIALTDVSTSAKTFSGGGKTFGVLALSSDGSSGTTTLTGANTFVRMTCPDLLAKAIILPGSTTTTFTGTNPFPSGAAGNLLTFTASSGTANVAFTSQASCDYLSLTNITASGTVPAYAGANSTLSGTTTNWVASAPPAAGQPTASRWSGVPGANGRQQLSGRGW